MLIIAAMEIPIPVTTDGQTPMRTKIRPKQTPIKPAANIKTVCSVTHSIPWTRIIGRIHQQQPPQMRLQLPLSQILLIHFQLVPNRNELVHFKLLLHSFTYGVHKVLPSFAILLFVFTAQRSLFLVYGFSNFYKIIHFSFNTFTRSS